MKITTDDGVEIDVETYLDDYLERDTRTGLPSVLTLEEPFDVMIGQGGGKREVNVTEFRFRRPPSEAMDHMARLSRDPGNAYKHMRAFSSMCLRPMVDGDSATKVDPERHLGAKVCTMDFHRLWEASQDFLPKPKPKAENSSGDSEE